MEDGFNQEGVASPSIPGTLEELACLQQDVSPTTRPLNSNEQNILNVNSGSEIPTSAINTQHGQTEGQIQTNTQMDFHDNASSIAEVHSQGGNILTSEYIIVQDPIELHSYADFSSAAMISSFTLPEDKNNSVLIVSGNDVYANNYTIDSLCTTGVESSSIDMNTKLKPKAVDIKTTRKETILAVPVIGQHKPFRPSLATSKGNSVVGHDRLPATTSQLQGNLKEQMLRSTRNDEFEKFDSTITKGTGDMLTDNIDTTMLVKDLMQANGSSKQQVPVAASAEAGTNTDEDLLAEFDASDDEMDQEENLLQKITQEKTTFSENLGLIPAEYEMKIIAERAKNAAKGVRTRKSYEQNSVAVPTEPVNIKKHLTNAEKPAESSVRIGLAELDVNQSHKHRPGCYRCGACVRSFPTICKLHEHLQDHCFGGSYHFDHLLKTAYPKYDTTCSYAQTNFDFDKENLEMILDAGKIEPNKKKNVFLKLRAPTKLKQKKSEKSVKTPPIGKRKRGRPKKVKVELIESGLDNCLQIDLSEPNEERDIGAKPEPAAYNIDGTEFENAIEPVPYIDADFEHIEESAAESFVENTFEPDENCDFENVAGNKLMIRSELENEKKKKGKRKSSIPRKIMLFPDSDSDKTMQNRAKPEMKIQCEFCPNKFQYTRGLIKHEQEKHADQMKFSCDQCDEKFMREYNLERHKLCAHTVGKSKLTQHGKKMPREKKKKGQKTEAKSTESSIQCQICGRNVPESKFDIHIRIHTGERPYICHFCGKGLISEKKLKRHLLIHSDEPRHTCEVCGQGFSMKYKLRIHMFIHTGHKPYLCSVCGAEFNNSTSLLHHNRTVHLGDKRFECTICGGKYGKKSQLEEHMFSHSDERTQTCRFCGKSFKHAKSLRRHEMTHVSDQKFQCDQCESKFSRKDNLERHKMCHFEATFQCSFCKKKFRERQPLVEHEQFHVNQRKQTCQICKERFQDETYFFNHMEKNHGVTRDMVPMITTPSNFPTKEVKSRRSGDLTIDNLILNTVKGSGIADTNDNNLSTQERPQMDTINLSMSVAGIIPVSGPEIGNSVQSNMHSGSAMAHNNIINQLLNVNQNASNINMNASRILNQPANTSIVSTGSMFGMNEIQRIALNVMNSGDNGNIRLPLDPPGANVTLPADNTITQEQQRIIQEAVGTALPNLQGQGYRLQNIFNQ